MSQRIKCYTLFNITKTGIRQRTKVPEGVDVDKFILARNTQANFDTLLQVISLRSQPEIVYEPTVEKIKLYDYEFGMFYQSEDQVNCWNFVFEVHHLSVFDDGENEFGHLLYDCNGIPMIKTGFEFDQVIDLLSTSVENKNIHFEIL